MRKYGSIAVLGILLSGAGLACGTSSRSPFVNQEDARINIEVVSLNFQDATVYALWRGERRRLGVVTIGQDGRFMLPWPTSYELRFEIDLLAGSNCTTRPIRADPGDVILLEIRGQMIPSLDCDYYRAR